MILPSKRLSETRSLISVGGELLRLLDEPKTMSRLLSDFEASGRSKDVSFDWVVLSACFLFSIGAIDEQDGRLRRTSS